MSQMPDKIWVHKDTKYNTGDVVCGYQYECAQEIEREGIENFVEYVPINAFIERAKAWFIEHINVSQNIETNEDGEPLADSYIKYAKSRLNAANEIFEDFIKYVKGE